MTDKEMLNDCLEVLGEIRVYAEMLRRFNAPWASKEYNDACQQVGNTLLNMIIPGSEEIEK